MTATAVETPSGKGAGNENFPVGSWLLPAALRPHVACFYAFARAADDIADSAALAPDDKIARLDSFEAVVSGRRSPVPGLEKPAAMRRSLGETGVSERHCLDLLSAFKQDAVKLRYESWDELIDYCERSAAPVGRYLLDLHGCSADAYPASDALCNALQVLNHLQDCKVDYRRLDRVYLPTQWLDDAGTGVTALDASAANPALRAVFDRTLDATDALIAEARGLPAQLLNRRLAMEASVIVAIAERLSRELRQRDPIAERVELSKPRYLGCALIGIMRALV